MPQDLLIDRMHGSLVCLAARKKGKRESSESFILRPLHDAEGVPVPLVAKGPSLGDLLDAIAEDEFSPDW